MAATVQIGPYKAKVDGYRWTGQHQPLILALNAMLDPMGPSGADPNPDLHAAMAAVEAFGGEVLEYDETEWEEGVVY